MRSVFVAWAAASAVGCTDARSTLGTVALALQSDECTTYCAAITRAELFRVGEEGFPLGPALTVSCGEPMVFGGLPAGTVVFATLEVFDQTGTRRLSGRSTNVTVPTDDGVADAIITLEADDDVTPSVTSVTPDPIVVADGDEVATLAGQLQDEGEVHLGDDPLETDWDSAEVTVGDGMSGALVVESCGVPSAPYALRVISSTFGSAPVSQVPGCTAAAMVPDGAGALIAFDCGAGQSYVQRFAPGTCPLDGDEVWSLPAAPTALAPGIVGLAGGGVATFDPATTDAPVKVNGGSVIALVSGAAGTFGIVDGKLARFDGTFTNVPGIEPTFTLIDVAMGTTLMALASSNGEARLIALSPDPLVRSVPLCAEPRAFAVDGERALIACAVQMVIVPREGEAVPIAIEGDRVALDARGDVAFLWSVGDALSVVALGSPKVLHTWSTGVDAPRPLLTRLDAPLARLLVSGADGLSVWTPYEAGGPCH